ncbi:MAG: hypothetical protein LAT84_10060 [Balneolia bacterium]|nr:hypothetical protein [Balneolia bacterium]
MEAIVPDRPGFSTGTYTVPVGELYVETGYRYLFRSNLGVELSNMPQINLRTGLTSKIEIFIEWDGFEKHHGQNEIATEWPLLGGKVKLTETEALELTLIVGLGGFSSGNMLALDHLVGVMWEIDISDMISNFGGVQIESEHDENNREWLPATALGAEINLSDKISLVTELYSIYSINAKNYFTAVELAVLILPINTVQIDFHSGLSLSSEIPHYLGLGVSFAFK